MVNHPNRKRKDYSFLEEAQEITAEGLAIAERYSHEPEFAKLVEHGRKRLEELKLMEDDEYVSEEEVFLSQDYYREVERLGFLTGHASVVWGR